MKRVVVFGVFDLIHPGHLYFLREAKKRGDHLTVVVSRDKRVLKRKKSRPFFNERERLEIVRSLKWVNTSTLGDRVGEWKILKRLRPSIVCVGYDQDAGVLKNYTLRHMPKVIRIKALNKKRYSSTKFKNGLYARH